MDHCLSSAPDLPSNLISIDVRTGRDALPGVVRFLAGISNPSPSRVGVVAALGSRIHSQIYAQLASMTRCQADEGLEEGWQLAAKPCQTDHVAKWLADYFRKAPLAPYPEQFRQRDHADACLLDALATRLPAEDIAHDFFIDAVQFARMLLNDSHSPMSAGYAAYLGALAFGAIHEDLISYRRPGVREEVARAWIVGRSVRDLSFRLPVPQLAYRHPASVM